MRLQSRGGTKYVQKSRQSDSKFAAEVNGIRSEKYGERIIKENEEGLTGDNIRYARKEGAHPRGFENQSEKAKPLPERVILLGRDETVYKQEPGENDKRFAKRIYELQKERYRGSDVIVVKLDSDKIRYARKGAHPKGFLNLHSNAVELPDRVILEGPDGTVYEQTVWQDDEQFAKEINDDMKAKDIKGNRISQKDIVAARAEERDVKGFKYFGSKSTKEELKLISRI